MLFWNLVYLQEIKPALMSTYSLILTYWESKPDRWFVNDKDRSTGIALEQVIASTLQHHRHSKERKFTIEISYKNISLTIYMTGSLLL